ncbi:flagellar biosynthetic protein FliR [Porcipelethomonas sp.]|uniref:flagellar biosynthetic protein FliR n=1 Tax=Porcipelethomonas sp. TaxID=2981675 RepID=UPI003EF7F1AD
MESLNFVAENIDIYVLVFARMAGILLMNPIISKNTIPSALKMGIILCTTVLITPIVPIPENYEAGTFDFLLNFGKEIFIGFLLGYVFNIFYYMLMTAADVLDINFGFAMAKVFDPATNIQSAFTAHMMNALFILYFFATDSHLTLISLAVSSFDCVPIGFEGFSALSAATFAIDIFSSAFALAMKLAIPFIAAEFILEISMGILMKLIPQIHVFVIEYQLKILMAIVLLMIMANPIAVFIDNYITVIFDNMQGALESILG